MKAERPQEQASPLYPQLKGGRRCVGAPTPEQVAADQRARLRGALIEATVQDGYGATTVRKLCALAGISSLTFYKLFPGGKGECFADVHRRIAKRTARRVAMAHLAGGDSRQRLARAFDAFAHEIATQPKLARLALIEALGAGEQSLQQVEHVHMLFEGMVNLGLQGADADADVLPPLVVKGIVAGIARVARVRVIEGRAEELGSLGTQLTQWALGYLSPATAGLQTLGGVAYERPQGLHGIGRDHPSSNRDLILRTAARLAALEGAGSLNVSQISHASGVPIGRFDLDLRDPLKCVIAAAQMLTGEALSLTLAAARLGVSWRHGTHRGMAALTHLIAHDPVFARLMFVELFATGAAGIEAGEAMLQSFADSLWESAPPQLRPTALVREATIGAVWGIIHHYVIHGACRRLPGAIGHLTYMLIAPAIGAERAVQTILDAQEKT